MTAVGACRARVAPELRPCSVPEAAVGAALTILADQVRRDDTPEARVRAWGEISLAGRDLGMALARTCGRHGH